MYLSQIHHHRCSSYILWARSTPTLLLPLTHLLHEILSILSIWWHNFMNEPKRKKKLVNKEVILCCFVIIGVDSLVRFLFMMRVYKLPYCLSLICQMIFCPYNYYYLWMYPYCFFFGSYFVCGSGNDGGGGGGGGDGSFFFHIVFTGRCRWGEWMMRSIPFTWLKKMIRLVSSTCDYLTPNYTVHSSIKSKYDDDGQRRRVAADSREVTGLDGGR